MVKATVTVCFGHQNHGEGNGLLPSPCVFGTKTMVEAMVSCLHHVFVAPQPACLHRVFISPKHTRSMVKATAFCLPRVFFAPKQW